MTFGAERKKETRGLKEGEKINKTDENGDKGDKNALSEQTLWS